MPTISPPAVSVLDAVQDPCGADELALRTRRNAAISVVTTALIVLAAVVCAIYVK